MKKDNVGLDVIGCSYLPSGITINCGDGNRFVVSSKGIIKLIEIINE